MNLLVRRNLFGLHVQGLPQGLHLVQCAHAAVNDKSPLYYKRNMNLLLNVVARKRAIIAIARMILTAITGLSAGEQVESGDLYKIDMPVALVEKQRQKLSKQA